jgi:YidC/Oxa1 family membrane protein insertase
MDTTRLVLLVIFCVSLFMLGEKWYKEYGPKLASAPTAVEPSPGTDFTPVPGTAKPAPSTITPTPTGGPTAKPEAGPIGGGDLVSVRTDLMHAEISTLGGDIRKVELLAHRDTVDLDRNLLLLDFGAKHTMVAQTGLIGSSLPNHKTVFVPDQRDIHLADGADTAVLTLTAVEPGSGTKVVKTLTFHRGTYVIDIAYRIENHGAAALEPFTYYQLVRDDQAPPGESTWVPTFTGVALFTDKDKYHKIAFSDIAKDKAKYPKESQDGWIGMVQHYFVTAWLPKNGGPREFYTRSLGNGLFAAGVILPGPKVDAGSSAEWNVPLYVGPQEQEKLAALAPGLDLTVDYGWLTVIAAPLFWVLSAVHGVVKNWGVAIIIVTIIIKLIFFPLSAASYKSMAKMRIMAPKLQKLKEIHGDDRQKLHQAMMELYKTEKINPLGGCLPIVIQIPVFIALYWVLLGSVEMRQAPFMLWIQDLSRPDPFYVLPILMGISMIIQTRLNPEPPDPIQAKVMKIMPIAFSVFFFFFPAGLVLYWLVNNILSIGQQWAITRRLENAGLAVQKR